MITTCVMKSEIRSPRRPRRPARRSVTRAPQITPIATNNPKGWIAMLSGRPGMWMPSSLNQGMKSSDAMALRRLAEVYALRTWPEGLPALRQRSSAFEHDALVHFFDRRVASHALEHAVRE